MKRARLIIKEIKITRLGEIKNFQVKLPKNVRHIVAIETDVRLDQFLKDKGASDTGVIVPIPVLETKAREAMAAEAIGREGNAPYLSWTQQQNPVVGKLKLKSMERTYIFYEEWLHFIFFNGGVPDMSMGMFNNTPFSLNKNRMAKKVDVPIETTIVNGIYEDSFGAGLKRDVAYTVKVFVWAETEEDSDGIVFDFQEEKKEKQEQEKQEEHG